MRRVLPIARARGAVVTALMIVPLLLAPARGGDARMWGLSASRNGVSDEVGLPAEGKIGPVDKKNGEMDLRSRKNVKWVAQAGNVHLWSHNRFEWRVFIGTNNGPRDPKYVGDYGIILCLSEATGQLLWQQAVPKLAAGDYVDISSVGVCSAPTVDGDRVYASIGQDGDRMGHAGCLDCIAVDSVDGAAARVAWRNTNVGNVMASCAVTADALFLVQTDCILHCLNPENGGVWWSHDLECQTWGGPLVADGKVYVVTDNGTMVVLGATTAEKRVLGATELGESAKTTAVAAHRTVYVAAEDRLIALEKRDFASRVP